MNYKILCSDLDGTLLSSKNDVSDTTISEISKIKRKLKVVLVSARMPKAMTYLQKRLGIVNEPIVCYNGALVMQGKKKIFSTTIDLSLIEKIYLMTKELGINIGFYHGEDWFASENTYFIQKEIQYTKTSPIFMPSLDILKHWRERKLGAHKLMLMGNKKALDLIVWEIKRELASKLILYRSSDILIEVAPQNTSKLLGIQKLLNDNQSLDDVIAFGDNYNDIEMIKGVGYGVAVGNARDEVKAISDYITLNNIEDGVAHFISKYLSI